MLQFFYYKLQGTANIVRLSFAIDVPQLFYGTGVLETGSCLTLLPSQQQSEARTVDPTRARLDLQPYAQQLVGEAFRKPVPPHCLSRAEPNAATCQETPFPTAWYDK